jgi:hypothetical protein
MKNQHIINEADFTIPDGWEEISVAERESLGGGAPVPSVPVDRFGSGAISSSTFGLPTDQVNSQLPGNIPTHRILPPQPSSVAANAAATSSFTKPLQQLAANAQALANQANTTANQALAATWQGAWSSIVTYSLGAIVESGGVVYVSLANQNLGNSPASSPSEWMATGADTFLGAWSSSTAYVIGDIVSVGSALYIAIANSTNENPTTTSGFWSLITGNSVYEGAWSSLTAYSPGQTVSYTDGNFYICIVANTNVPPTPTGSTDWVLLGTSNTLIGAWSSSVAYSAGNQVTNAGNIFQALQANTNHTPPTPPATSAFWQLIGPSSLDAVPDGGSRFGQTGSGLSYRPLTNPLTGHDAGSNATVNIASFTNRTSSKGDISYNSGSITALSYGTLYFIYFDDGSLAGGTVTYHASATKTDALNGSGRFFVGSVTTPIATAPDTIGNNDGGTGAQSGSTITFFPGTNVPTTTGGGSITNDGEANDGNLTTAAQLLTSTPGTVGSAQVLLSGLGIVAAPWTSLTLNIRSAVVSTSASTLATLSYSLNGGSTFTNIYNLTNTTRALATDTITLPINQNLALVQVRAKISKVVSADAQAELDLYEAWVVGVE